MIYILINSNISINPPKFPPRKGTMPVIKGKEKLKMPDHYEYLYMCFRVIVPVLSSCLERLKATYLGTILEKRGAKIP